MPCWMLRQTSSAALAVTNAARLVRTPGPAAVERTLQTSAGEVNLKVPKLRRQTFETAIIDRYRRRESSVEEALIEMYLAGISVRRVEDITEALWGTRVSPSTVSDLNKKIPDASLYRKGDVNSSPANSTNGFSRESFPAFSLLSRPYALDPIAQK